MRRLRGRGAGGRVGEGGRERETAMRCLCSDMGRVAERFTAPQLYLSAFFTDVVLIVLLAVDSHESHQAASHWTSNGLPPQQSNIKALTAALLTAALLLEGEGHASRVHQLGGISCLALGVFIFSKALYCGCTLKRSNGLNISSV